MKVWIATDGGEFWVADDPKESAFPPLQIDEATVARWKRVREEHNQIQMEMDAAFTSQIPDTK